MVKSRESLKWEEAKQRISGIERIELGPYFSEIRYVPRRVLFAMSHYKFAAKMLGEGKDILEVGCSEGLCTLLLAENAKTVLALDSDEDAITVARQSFETEKLKFICEDFLTAKTGQFDGVVSLDVIEHIYPENEELFVKKMREALRDYGVCIIGTPNKNAESYASPGSIIGHVNTFTWERLKLLMERHFHIVFMFSANDEIVHTGYYPMAHYLLAMAVCPRK